MARKGRPEAEDPKEVISFRVEQSLLMKFQEYAQRNGMTVPEFLLDSGKKRIETLDEFERFIIRL